MTGLLSSLPRSRFLLLLRARMVVFRFLLQHRHRGILPASSARHDQHFEDQDDQHRHCNERRDINRFNHNGIGNDIGFTASPDAFAIR